MGNEQSTSVFQDRYGSGGGYNFSNQRHYATGAGFAGAAPTTRIMIAAHHEKREYERRAEEMEGNARRQRKDATCRYTSQSGEKLGSKRDDQTKIDALTSEVNDLQRQYNAQMAEMRRGEQEFESKGISEKDKVIIVIGEAGMGKSTLCNRLYGDESKDGGKGPFDVHVNKIDHDNDHDNDVNIKHKQKWFEDKQCKYLIVDSTNNNNNNTFLNKIGSFGKKLHHINGFFIVIHAHNILRAEKTILILKDFEKVFTNDIYKYCTVVITGIDEINWTKEQLDCKITQLRKTLFGNNYQNIKYLTIGCNDYKIKVKELRALVNNINVFCAQSKINTPLDQLKQRLDFASILLSQAKQTRDQAQENINNV